MNTESINLMGNPSDFVEPYFKKNPELLVIVPYSVNFVKKTLDFVKMILKSKSASRSRLERGATSAPKILAVGSRSDGQNR